MCAVRARLRRLWRHSLFQTALSSVLRRGGAYAARVLTAPVFHTPKIARRGMAMDKADLYEKAEEYWTNASADVDGMLGGFAELHEPDVQQSRQFLLGLKQKKLLLRMEHALDCGGGIGRVTKHLLIPMFGKVDMEELVEELVEQSFEYIGKDPRMGERFVEGLQTFTPPKGRYDLIWIQWVSGHLTEDDFIAFFQRCKEGLREGGVICLKDNLASGETADFDAEDHSWCRPEKDILSLFDRAGLKLVHKQAQTNFPKGMYKVKMFALK